MFWLSFSGWTWLSLACHPPEPTCWAYYTCWTDMWCVDTVQVAQFTSISASITSLWRNIRFRRRRLKYSKYVSAAFNCLLYLFIRPHRMHAVQRCSLWLQISQVTWSVCLSVCMSVCVLVSQMCCAKSAEPIEIQFRKLTLVCSWIRWGQDPTEEWAILGVFWPIEKHWESLMWRTQQKHHSVLSN